MRAGVGWGAAAALLCLPSLAAAPEGSAGQAVAAELRVRSPDTAELPFDLPSVPKGQQVRLSLDARVDWPGLDGFNPWVVVRVNGRALTGPDLLNKPLEFTTRNGVDFVWEKGGAWTVLYSPDFSDAIRTVPMPWGFADVDPYRFVWNVTPYVRAGLNRVSFTHLQLLAQGTTLVLRSVAVAVGPRVEPAGAGQAGARREEPLRDWVARGRRPVAMDVGLSPRGAIRLHVGGRTFVLASRTSEPQGRWVETTAGAWRQVRPGRSVRAEWSGTGYRVVRRVQVRQDHVHVADTVQNTSDTEVGVIYENRLDLSSHPRAEVLLCGRPVFALSQTSEEPAHPSAIARWDRLTLGLFAEDDIFRVHVRAFVTPTALGLADPRLGLPAGKGHTLEWSIYPVPRGDYWDLINAVRRNWGCNTTIPGPGLFDHESDGSRTDGYFRDMVWSRGLRLAFTGQTAFRDGLLAEGTAIPLAREWCASAAQWVRKLHAADARVRTLIYLHPSICTEPGAQTRYADCRLLDASGNHVTSPYHYPVYEYVATENNAYGKALFSAVERIFAEIAPDGIYMDEISRGSVPQYAYGAPWDGCTLLIDPVSHAVTGRCSSVVLLTQGWKSALVRYLRRRGKLLVGNGPPYTRTMLRWRVPMFTELGSYSFLVDMHLSTPWALGNHDNENNDRVRSRMVRRALKYAGVIAAYSWGDRPQGFHYLRAMYPITPVELHEGMVLGKERIVTNRSGRYGWPDGVAARVFVFGPEGRLVPNPAARHVRRGRQRLVELRLPPEHFAVLVRR